MKPASTRDLSSQIEDLQHRLEESEQLIQAIKAGEVDAFAMNKNNRPEVFTLYSGDYAYRVLVENFGEGAVNLTEEGLIVYSNTSFHKALGLTYEQVIGNPIFNFIHPDSKVIFNEIFRKGLAGQSKGEIYLSAGNNKVPVYVSLTTLYPTLSSIGMIITDLSDRKEAERKIEEQNIELQRKNKELEAFNYISSHDLQEPLRKLQMFSGLITQRETLSDSGKEYFLRMNDVASRMQALIQDLLNFSRLAITERKCELTDLNSILTEIKEEFTESIEAKHATIQSDKLDQVYVIPFQFRQLLQNLIGNALKFSKPGVPPVIKVKSEIAKGSDFNNTRLHPETQYCHVTVSDNGIGFENRFAEKIFEVFQMLHGKEEYPGTGIGLSIVKKIVENHDGFITATSEPGHGARFDIYFPT